MYAAWDQNRWNTKRPRSHLGAESADVETDSHGHDDSSRSSRICIVCDGYVQDAVDPIGPWTGCDVVCLDA